MSIPSIRYLLRRDNVTDVTADAELSGGSIKVAAEDIPHDWTNKWSHFGVLDEWQGFPNDKAWCIRHWWNFIGQPELLLYRRHNEESTIFRAGGLYFFLGEEELFVFHANVTLLDILHALRHNEILNIMSDEPLKTNPGALSQGGELDSFSYLEVRTLERDRRKEQMQRGGFPPSTVFSQKNGVWTYANPNYQQYAREECHPSDEEPDEASGDSDASEEYTSGQDDQNSNDEKSESSRQQDGSDNRDGSNSEESVEDDKSGSVGGDADRRSSSPDELKIGPESRDIEGEDPSACDDADKRSSNDSLQLPSTGDGLHQSTSAEDSISRTSST